MWYLSGDNIGILRNNEQSNWSEIYNAWKIKTAWSLQFVVIFYNSSVIFYKLERYLTTHFLCFCLQRFHGDQGNAELNPRSRARIWYSNIKLTVEKAVYRNASLITWFLFASADGRVSSNFVDRARKIFLRERYRFSCHKICGDNSC